MEDLLKTVIESGNATAILTGVLVYLIVFLQRKNTATARDDVTKKMQDRISSLEKESELKQKDIEYLMNENSGIKEDIKEIKATLNQIAISLAEIAAPYKSFKEAGKR
jgi:septal ring factor EnvC (AmiA/AmiB activator)